MSDKQFFILQLKSFIIKERDFKLQLWNEKSTYTESGVEMEYTFEDEMFKFK